MAQPAREVTNTDFKFLAVATYCMVEALPVPCVLLSSIVTDPLVDAGADLANKKFKVISKLDRNVKSTVVEAAKIATVILGCKILGAPVIGTTLLYGFVRYAAPEIRAWSVRNRASQNA